ncbi:hypothetical protein Ddc_05332 [Ditylenchus destructor]|nr:hypothetical protein Ddc_05332 [Ditylenchus destructor]
MLRMVRELWKVSSLVKVEGKIPLVLYRSRRSNLKVAVGDVPGPMVKGMISFVTETHSDDGLPHTLEHLVFMGSRHYPYKGVLDVIANRFLKVLPVYLDHLLAPNLTNSQYLTEVHHVNGDGEDAGVVYSEMQDHESEMERMVSFRRKKLMYPPNSSYGVDTGVCGMIDHDRLLESIEPIEERELENIPADFERPFQMAVPPISQEKVEKIVCPADDETKGIVELSWVGPDASDLYTSSALSVLFAYLTETAVAPLKRDFVQTDDPYCSSVGAYMLEQKNCEVVVSFSGVPTEKLEAVKDRFFDKTVADHTDAAVFDMERIGFLIDQSVKKCLSKLENNPGSMIFGALIGHQLYGEDEENSEQLRIRVNDVETYKKLKQEPPQFWQNLFSKTFKSGKLVCVMGEPSAEAVEEFSNKEDKRIEEQQKRLGKNGLVKCAETLERAIQENTANKPGDEVLRELIVKEFQKFNMFPVSTSTNATASQPGDNFIDNLPFTAVLHTIPSDFVDMVLLVDSESVPVELRHYMLLWFELMFQSPAIVDGQVLGYEDISKLTTKDLVNNSITVGVSSYYDRFVDAENYKNLAKWAEIYLKNIVFDPKRIAICAKKLYNAAADIKRDGHSVAAFLSSKQIYDTHSNASFYSHLSLEKFHKDIATEVEKDPVAVIAKLEEVRKSFLNSSINLHFACDPAKIPGEQKQNVEMWNWLSKPSKLESGNGKEVAKNIFDGSPTPWSVSALQRGKRAVAVGGTESAFLIQRTRFGHRWSEWQAGNSSLNSPIMETLLLAQYLSQCEGPLWNSVRGKGLAYDASIYVQPDTGTLTLSLYRCSQIAQAYEQTKKVVQEIISKGNLEESQFEAAKRSLVCELIGAQGSIKSVAQTALLNTLRNVDSSMILKLCSQIWYAEMSNVVDVGSKPILQLFDDSQVIRSIVVNPSKVKDMLKAFPETEVVKLEELQLGLSQ